MMMLAISRNSFHYRYYQTLRKMWGMGDTISYAERTSLCIYTQFLFWFSLLTIVAFPIIAGGWLFLKTGRALYKICSWTPVGRFLLDVLDKFGLGDKIDKVSDSMEEAPAFVLAATFCVVIAFSILMFILLGLFIGGVVYLKTILLCIAALLLGITLLVFYAGFGIGWVLAHALTVACLVIKTVALFFMAYIVALVWCLVILSVLALVSFIVVKLITSSEKLMTFLGFKLNGYHKAREESATRRAELQRLHDIEEQKRYAEEREIKRKKANGEIPYTPWESFVIGIGKCFVKIGECLAHFFLARTKNVKGGTYKVMSGMGVVWETVKSLKEGVCPFVEFVDENEEVGE